MLLCMTMILSLKVKFVTEYDCVFFIDYNLSVTDYM